MTITFPSPQDLQHLRTESNQQNHWLLLRRFPWCLKKTQGMFSVVLQMCHQAVLLVSFMSSTPSTSSNDQNPNKKYFHNDGWFLQKKEHKMTILVDRTEFTIHNFVTCLVFAHSHKVTQFNRSHSSRKLRARTSSTKTRRTSSGTSTTTTTTLSTTCGSNLSRLGNTSTRFTITSNHLLAFPWSDT